MKFTELLISNSMVVLFNPKVMCSAKNASKNHHRNIIQYKNHLYVICYSRACVWKVQHEGVCREANIARGEVECCICLETPPECCIFFIHISIGGASTVILYFPSWLSGLEQFSLVLKPLRFLVMRISVSV